MKTTSHILLVIIVCFITLITKSQAAPDPKAKPAFNAYMEPGNIFRIEIRRDTWVDEAVFAFFTQALDSYDPYDSEKMFAVDDNYPETYTLTTDNVICAINSETNLTMDEEKVIPLGFLTYVSGTFTFVATNISGFDPTISVYLEDVQENVSQDLKINNMYTFSSGVADNATRFRLHYIKTTNAAFNAGAILTTGQTICYNGDPSVIGNSALASGGDGSIAYQWQSCTNAGFSSPVNISANTSTYDPPAGLAVNTWYRRQAKDGTGSTGFISSTGVWAVTVNPILPVSVSISVNPGTTVCPGTSVTYMATPTNGGTVPTYQWKRNGNNISGATNSTYTSTVTVSSNGEIITCVMTSSETCTYGSPAISNSLIMTVEYLQAGISIAASPGTTVCPGTSITFNATTANGGTAPTYQWKLNGNDISGATNNTYAYIVTPNYNGKKINCMMTSNESCILGSPAISNTLKMTIKQSPKNSIITEAGNDLFPDNATLKTGLSSETIGDDISIYPNPATNSIILDYTGYQVSDKCELWIYSIDGKLLLNNNLKDKTTIIDVDSYESGIYYIRIMSSNETRTRKFIKE
jgi:hypothetical protein